MLATTYCLAVVAGLCLTMLGLAHAQTKGARQSRGETDKDPAKNSE